MKKIYIASVTEIKRGKNKFGKDWTLYAVKDQQGVQYSTFEGKYLAMQGQEVDVEIEERIVEKNGKTYKNFSIVEPKREPMPNKINELIFEHLKIIEAKLTALQTALAPATIEKPRTEANIGQETPF